MGNQVFIISEFSEMPPHCNLVMALRAVVFAVLVYLAFLFLLFIVLREKETRNKTDGKQTVII